MGSIDEELLCGTLDVYENRMAGSGHRIAINIIVVPALSEDPEPVPLVSLAGGPGVAASTAAEEYVRWMPQFRRDRDVVLVDQRGTGGSNPLHCDLASGHPNPHGLLNEMYPPDAVERCRTELEQIADLRLYTTEVAARDLEEIRQWLGYEQLHLFGVSYGTRAALVYMRYFPDRVKSALFVGATPTNLLMPSHHARDGHRSMDLLLADCLSDKACSAAFPDIRNEWKRLLDRLGSQPAEVVYTRPDTGEEISLVIERDIFAEVIRSRLYAPITMRRIPLVIHRAYHGDLEPFIEFANLEWEPHEPFLAEGMYLSVTCAEDLPFIDHDALADINELKYFGNYRVEQQKRACTLWPRGAVQDGYHEPVQAEVPTLIVSGPMDPVTPPYWGEEVARYLPYSRHIVVPGMSHSPAGMSNVECLIDLMAGFVEQSAANQLDLTCLDDMVPPPFVIRDD